jgi:hypothetical protein
VNVSVEPSVAVVGDTDLTRDATAVVESGHSKEAAKASTA